MRRLAGMAETYYVDVAPWHEGGPIASAAALDAAASMPNFFVAQSRGSGAGTALRDGFFELPKGPGPGITVDEKTWFRCRTLVHKAPQEKKNISRRGPLNRRSLGFARDDKGEGGFFLEMFFDRALLQPDFPVLSHAFPPSWTVLQSRHSKLLSTYNCTAHESKVT